MKKLSQITKEVYKEYGYDSWFEACQDFKSVDGVLISKMVDNRLMKEVSRRFAKEVAREALKNAADNAKVDMVYEQKGNDPRPLSNWVVDKQSILDEDNIPEL